MLATDRVHVLRQAIMSRRKGGTISIPDVYVGMGDKIPLGAAMNKGLTLKMGQTHVRAHTRPLLEKLEAGEIDPSFVVTSLAAQNKRIVSCEPKETAIRALRAAPLLTMRTRHRDNAPDRPNTFRHLNSP